MSVASLFTPCFVMFCVFLYGPFCHGAHKLDLSTLFTTFFLWTSPPFIFSQRTPRFPSEFKDNKYMQEESYPTAPDISITTPGIWKLLNSLKTNKAPGTDSIQPRILKDFSLHIAPILTVIFNYSIETGDIQSDWRNANGAPIYKKGSRYNPENCRPISLTCICCKLLEHCITSHIMKHGETNNTLYPLQHGFKKRRSCETQLI